MSSAEFEVVLQGAQSDLLRAQTEEGFMGSGPEGPFFCLFGRDGAITSIYHCRAYSLLPRRYVEEFLPTVRLTLHTLFSHQAKTIDLRRGARPGQILHELRYGSAHQDRLKEMKQDGHPVEEEEGKLSSLSYYSLDSTPLAVEATVEYIKLSGDWQFYHQHEENLLSAAYWMDHYADLDADGLAEFRQESGEPLLNPVWKDSNDSIRTREGVRPKEPIAPVEVQGYIYRANIDLEWLFGTAGRYDLADDRGKRAERTKNKLTISPLILDTFFLLV